MSALHGIGVLVTRPEQQAMPLCRLLELQGAVTLQLPAIEAKACGERIAQKAHIGALEEIDLVIFTSANAVRFGILLLEQRRDLTLAAIGPATARALQQYGHEVAVQPSAGYDSESLLIHPRLERISGQRILLIKGGGGRPLLEEECVRRGAQVVSVDVYERMPVDPTVAQIAGVRSSIEAGRLQVITATSLEIGGRLLEMEPAAEFRKLSWLVPGERVATALRQRGLLSPLVIAASADDRDLVEALVRWRSTESRA